MVGDVKMSPAELIINYIRTFDKEFELKLNLAWGGDWGGMMGVDESCLPATYEIDYVRVFQKK